MVAGGHIGNRMLAYALPEIFAVVAKKYPKQIHNAVQSDKINMLKTVNFIVLLGRGHAHKCAYLYIIIMPVNICIGMVNYIVLDIPQKLACAHKAA